MTATREAIQHIHDIEIPVIEITEGWAAEDCKTIDQCNDAFAYLMAAVASIEFQIDMENLKPKGEQNREWIARATCALKYKRAALQIVGQRRGVIDREMRRSKQDTRDRQLLEYIRRVVPDKQFLEWVRASFVNDIDEQQEAA